MRAGSGGKAGDQQHPGELRPYYPSRWNGNQLLWPGGIPVKGRGYRGKRGRGGNASGKGAIPGIYQEFHSKGSYELHCGGIDEAVCLPWDPRFGGSHFNCIVGSGRPSWSGKGYGADVCLVEGCYDDAYQKALELKERDGYTFVHPFDDENVIAGQGTVGLEIMNDLDDIDAIIVPVGGGGLISGIAYAVKQIRPSIKIYGVQSAGAAGMYSSVKNGKIECLDKVQTVADGIAVKQPGENTFSLVREYVDDIALVSDDEISSAILALIEKQKMIAEGAGAASVAAAMFGKFPIKGKKTVCVVSGGNIDVTSLSRVIERGLMKSGRSSSLLIELIDKPGQLKEISRIIADCGANVTGVHYEKGETESVIGCFLRIEMETRDYNHVQLITRTLCEEGFKIV